jgi:nicotinamidase-related amidase
MKLATQNGKKTAVINVFIDPERGFMDLSLTDLLGGVLYVPDGEKVTPKMGEIISKSRDTIFILGQDYHPANHISFMVNHPGVMEYRVEKFREFLADNGQAIPTEEKLYLQAQQPVHFFNGFDKPPVPFPFNEIVLDENRNIIGVKEDDGRIRAVEIKTSSGLAPSEKDRGRVSKVLDSYLDKTFDEYRAEGRLLSTQTLWTKHCVQGTDSSLYPADMNLPQELKEKLDGDLMSSTVYHRDPATGNEFHVIRKGAQSEVDSYGIGVENDGETMTAGWEVFRGIASNLKKLGCENVVINVGGLATNFCVEFSANNIADFLAGHFKMRNMDVEVNFVPEISRGIPIPGGAETPFSLDGAAERMKTSRNIGETTIERILSMTAPGKPQAGVTHKFPKPGG